MRTASAIIFVAAIAVAVIFGGFFIVIGAFYAVCSAIMFFMCTDRGQRAIQRTAGREVNAQRPLLPARTPQPRSRTRQGGQEISCRLGTPQRKPRRKAIGHQHTAGCRCGLSQYRQGDITSKGQ